MWDEINRILITEVELIFDRFLQLKGLILRLSRPIVNVLMNYRPCWWWYDLCLEGLFLMWLWFFVRNWFWHFSLMNMNGIIYQSLLFSWKFSSFESIVSWCVKERIFRKILCSSWNFVAISRVRIKMLRLNIFYIKDWYAVKPLIYSYTMFLR